MKLENRVALVTGGGGAIGRAISLRLAREGASIAVCDIREEAAERVAQEVAATGREAIAIGVDLRDVRSIDQMVEQVAQRFNRIDILVTSAGGSARGKTALLKDADEDVIDMILDVNLRSVLFCARVVIPHMIRQRYGKIVNIGSVVGIGGKSRFADYTAAKAGVIALTRTLAMEVGEYGINVNCVSPGIVPRAGEKNDLERIRKTNYLRRIGKVEDVANMVNFLVSEEADFITGQNFIVDGGRSLGLTGD